ncbi:MAG: tRNA (N(6)-L-threonylcarbamoyladenosine(37)-C(2))-methylthiotransferase [Candidatus Diapherotrites archaeon]|nr:tRNA (N(6)-L-threonylcarbamoyladenosine(37)-C(2))-methylthiotransferase [Candidatus Diapherotrites archaeon]
MKAYIESYGCAHNESDARIIRAILKEQGLGVAGTPDNADYIFINTCGVLHTTEQRMLSRIQKLAKHKAVLVVCGCLPKINEKAIRKAAPNAVLLDTNSLGRIPELLKNPKDFFSDERENKLSLPCPTHGITAVIGIGEGCAGNCHYCATKHARGSVHSYAVKDVVSAVGSAVANGAREAYLTSEDTGCYGIDVGSSLPELLNEITRIPGDFKIRVGMMTPNHAKKLLPELIAAYQTNKLYNFIHLPIQSGSDKVLREMNRQYTVAEFEGIVSQLRKGIPGACISTDVIVGFPTETGDDFEETLALLRRVRPDITNVSKFGIRPNTAAAKMKQLPTEKTKARSVKASKLTREISLGCNQNYIGKEYKALALTEGSKGGVIGRAPNYKQLVFEGVVGKEYTVRVTAAFTNYLKAEPI